MHQIWIEPYHVLLKPAGQYMKITGLKITYTKLLNSMVIEMLGCISLDCQIR